MASQDSMLKSGEARKICREQVEEFQVLRYGHKYTEYRRRYEAAGRFEYEPPFPLYLMLEQTYLCNLRCPMCIQGLPTQREAFETNGPRMSRELFEKVVLEGEQYECPSIAMMVNDEPLLVKDLPERIQFATDHGFMDVFMTTNGVLFTEDKVKQVIDAGVTHVNFSIDGATRETYDKIRIGGDYDKVLEAIAMVRRYRTSRQSVLPLIRASFVQNRLNQHEAHAFYEKFSELADFVEIQGFSSYYEHTDHLIPEGVKPADEFTCNEPWRKLIVRADGDVLPCCTFYGYEIVLGNIRDTSLFELYNSPRMKQIRSDFKQGIYKESPCDSCSKSFYLPSVKL